MGLNKSTSGTPLPQAGLQGFLEPNSFQRMVHSCKVVLGSNPSRAQLGILAAYSNLAKISTRSLQLMDCSCTGMNSCNLYEGWPPRNDQKCYRSELWAKIGQCLIHAFWCFFLNIGTNTSISVGQYELFLHNQELLNSFLGSPWKTLVSFDCEFMHKEVMYLVTGNSRGIGESSGAVTIYPTTLRKVKLAPGLPVIYEILDGKFMLNGLYYLSLRGRETSSRTLATKVFQPGMKYSLRRALLIIQAFPSPSKSVWTILRYEVLYKSMD